MEIKSGLPLTSKRETLNAKKAHNNVAGIQQYYHGILGRFLPTQLTMNRTKVTFGTDRAVYMRCGRPKIVLSLNGYERVLGN